MLLQVGGRADHARSLRMTAAELDLKLCCCRWQERVTHVVAPSLTSYYVCIRMTAAELDLELCCCRWQERVTHVMAPSLTSSHGSFA